MAAANRNNEDQHRKELQRQESNLSRQRQRIPSNYPNVVLIKKFESPGKGLGIKAYRDIPCGTPIMSEAELFWVLEGRIITQSKARMPESQELSCPIQPETDDARFKANSFGMGQDRQGKDKYGIFAEASRFNHSCVPNAYFAWNSRSREITVHAIFDISKGDEIFINYRVNDFSKRGAERRQDLSRDYNFNCNCSACDGPDAAESENRRSRMRVLNNNIEQNRHVTQPERRREQLAYIRSFCLLLQQENLLYPQLADMYGEEVQWYRKELVRYANGATSDMYKAIFLEDALQAARKKLDLDVCCTGCDSPEVVKTMKLIVGLRTM